MLYLQRGFCGGGPLWDTQRTWHSLYPRFTKCFEWTVLSYAGAAFLWPLALCSIFQKNRGISTMAPAMFLSVSKTIVVLMLIVCHAVSMVWNSLRSPDQVPLAGVLSSVIHLISCIVLLILQSANSRAGKTSCAIIWTYWLIETLTSLPRFYRVLLYLFDVPAVMDDRVSLGNSVLSTVTYSLTLISFGLNCFAESSSLDKNHGTTRPWPLLSAPPLSAMSFEWLTPFIVKGYKQFITEEDLFEPLPELKTSENYRIWLSHWNRELRRAKYNPEDGSFDRKSGPSLLKTLVAMFWPSFSFILFVLFVRAILRMSVALALHLITSYMQDESQPLWHGLLYSVMLLLVNSVSSLCLRHSDLTFAAMAIKIKSILTAAIYRKTLRMSPKSQGSYATGELVNLVSIDADRVIRLCTNVSLMIVSLFSVGLSALVLWQYLGPSCLAGIAVIVLMTHLSGFIAAKNRLLQEKQMEFKDCRLKSMSEIISSMKILKLFAWEPPFASRVEDIRNKEISLLKRVVYVAAGLGSLWACTPTFMCLISFISFLFVSPINVLTPAVAFVSLSLFQQIRLSMLTVPDYINNATQTAVAFERIRKFLLCEEINSKVVGNNPLYGDAISIRNLTAAWGGRDAAPVLSSINLSARTGKLVAIVGPVGSGKSSVVSSILGDLDIIHGTVDVVGSIAFVPQQAWIQNQTIRKNIIFTSELDRSKYEKVLDACCMRPDLSILPGGDQTEIGEKGINLSGGQRQRVALARAAYQNKEIYIFDDPLSALDAHVGKAIFDSLIGPEGMLNNKTRILVTNNLSVLPNVDYVVVLKDGRVVEEGTYADLMDSGGNLAGLLESFDSEKRSPGITDSAPVETATRSGIERRLTASRRETTASFEPVSGSAAEHDQGGRQEQFRITANEAVETGTITRSVYVTYLKRLGFSLSILMLTFYTVFQALDLMGGLWLSAWSEDRDQSPGRRRYRLCVYAAIGVLQGITSFGGVAVLMKATIKAATRLHQVILSSVMRAPLSFFDTTPVGRLLNRFGADLDQLDVQIPSMAKLMIEMLFRIIGVVVLISSKIPSFLLAAIPIMALFVAVRQVFAKTMRQIKRLEAVRRSPVFSHFSETINGLSSIRSFGAGDTFQEMNGEKVDAAQNCSLHVTISGFWLMMRLELLGNLLVFAMNVLVVINRGYFDAGTAGLLVAYSLGSIFAFNNFILYSSEVEASMVSVERIVEYTKIVSEAEWTSDDPPGSDWPSNGALSFESYATRYRPGLDLILKDVNLEVSPQQKVGVVGRTGAGKSSLILTIFRIIEAAGGRIVIDGLDIAKIGLHELRSKLTIIPQESVLFKASLRFNLDPNNECKDEELWEALERAHLKQFFELQTGLDTPIAEGGGNISVGQRQLICLARAILRKRKILVLDEATASVDLETDVLIQETIRSVFSDSTIITIAHRINTILDSDVVVVMSAGKITELGAPQDLLRNSESEFAALAREAGIFCDSTVRNDCIRALPP